MNLQELTIYSILVSFGPVDDITTLTQLAYICTDLGVIPKNVFNFKHHPVRLGTYESGAIAEVLWSLEVDEMVSTDHDMIFARQSAGIDRPVDYWISKLLTVFDRKYVPELATLLAASNVLGIKFKSRHIDDYACKLLFAGTLIPVDTIRMFHNTLQCLLETNDVRNGIRCI